MILQWRGYGSSFKKRRTAHFRAKEFGFERGGCGDFWQLWIRTSTLTCPACTCKPQPTLAVEFSVHRAVAVLKKRYQKSAGSRRSFDLQVINFAMVLQQHPSSKPPAVQSCVRLVQLYCLCMRSELQCNLSLCLYSVCEFLAPVL